jgi:hypothetical protein
MTTTNPRLDETFRDLDAILAREYAYLTAGLIEYRLPYPESARVLAVHESRESECESRKPECEAVYAFVADQDESVPYPANFPFLTRGENAAIASQLDVHARVAWPQPTISIWLPEGRELSKGVPGRTVSHDLPLHPATVALKKVGQASLWWGGDVGVIWEAFLDVDHPRLLDETWNLAERTLRERGASRCITTHRDPAYDDDGYRAYLEGRGYVFAADCGDGGERCASLRLVP